MFRARSKAACWPSPTRPTASRECLPSACMPTGSKDPFALRRAANGIVKIIAEHKLPLPIRETVRRRARRIRGLGSREALRPKIELRGRRSRTSCVSAWSFICRSPRLCLRRGERRARRRKRRRGRCHGPCRGCERSSRVGRLRFDFGRVQAHQEHPAAGARDEKGDRASSSTRRL